MNITLEGFPKSVIQARDASILPTATSNGVFAVQIATQRGEVNKAVYVSNKTQLRRQFGKWISGKLGMYEAEAALDGGAKLYVSRVGHYTDVSDTSTLQGDKSTGTLTVVTTAETRAAGSIVISVAGTAGNIITLVVNTGVSIITLGSYTVQSLDDEADVAAGLRAAINALSGTHGYDDGGSGATVTVTAPTGSGAAANSYVIGKTTTGTVDGNITQFSGGVTEIVSTEAGVSAWEGKHIGEGYDGITITTVKNVLDSTKVDITITLPDGTKDPQKVTSNRVLNATEIASLNTKLTDVKLATLTTRFPVGTATLTGGEYNVSSLTDNDYKGDSVAKTGVWSFNTTGGKGLPAPTRIANVERLVPAVDSEYSLYVDKKVFLRAFSAIPQGIDYQEALDYRNGTGSYSHTPIDNWRFRYVYAGGGLITYDPVDVSQEIILSGLGHVMGNRAITDTQAGVWISDAGNDFGKIAGTKGVVGNLYNEQEEGGFADLLYGSGINVIMDDATMGVVYWGNRTCLLDQTKQLKFDNVAELFIYIMIQMKAFSNKKLFKPNNPKTWSLLYQEVKLMADDLFKREAIADKENAGWFWYGDQFADSILTATFNDPTELSNGKYRAQFLFVPVVSMELIGIEVTGTDAGSISFAIATVA